MLRRPITPFGRNCDNWFGLSFLFMKMNFKTEKIEFSPIKRIQAEAEKAGAVSLAQGIPKFLPPLGIRKAAAAAIERGYTDFYGPPQGIEPLRKKIAARHLSEEGVFYDPNAEVIITAGALQGISAALITLLSPGDELIVPSPSYFPFLNLPRVLGIKPVSVLLQGDGWRLRISDLEKAINPKTAGILLTHPNNPTGTVYSEEELEAILKLAEKHNLLVFVDEVYRFFVYGVEYPSLGKFQRYRNRLIRVMSFSKAFALSGWRIGYLLADREAGSEIMKVHEMMTTASASLPAQYAALSALTDFPDLPFEFAEILRKRKERMKKRLEKLSSVFAFEEPRGAYYFFAKLLSGPFDSARGKQDDRAFCQKLLKEAGVALVPGAAFGEGGKGSVRFSFAAKEGEIDEAFDRLERYLLGEELGLTSVEEIVRGAEGVTDDSRKVKPGQIFVAIAGSKHDGHDFIPEAVKRGASPIIGEQTLNTSEVLKDSTSEVGYVKVGSSRRALGVLSSAWYGYPSKKLKVIGVTGTDGKTTTSHLLGAILKEAGLKASVLSTLNAPGVHTTTPPAPILQEWLAGEVKKGTEVAVLEVTSHGIAQERVAGVKFEGAVLTNITPEHLDYHDTFERYRETKAKLFRNVGFSVLNRDDQSFRRMVEVAGGRVVSYGFFPQAELRASGVKAGEKSCRFDLLRGKEREPLKLPLPGEYNVYNALAAAAAAHVIGVDPDIIKRGLERFDAPSLVGRFEGIEEVSDFKVVIDFAHTPNALAKVLNHAARVKPAGSQLLVVFGCAGERDRSKRPEMGRIAVRTADLAVITSEDPRSEDPKKIIDEIASGCFAEGAVEGRNFVRIPDRRKAICFALEQARRGDYLLILGKGHEPTMAIGEVEHPWSDHRVVKEEFARIVR